MTNTIPSEIFPNILKNLDGEEFTKEQLEILVFCLGHIFQLLKISSFDELWQLNIPLLKILRNMDTQLLEILNFQSITNRSEKSKYKTPFDCQLQIQKTLQHKKRKTLAAYYTNSEALEIYTHIIQTFQIQNPKSEYIICDPFMGAAKTLTCAVYALQPSKIAKIIGIEPFFLSALVGFTCLLDCMKGNYEKIHIIHGDAFDIINRQFTSSNQVQLSNTIQSTTQTQDSCEVQSTQQFQRLNLFQLNSVDIILTNPPFTRWQYLTPNQRKQIHQVMKNLSYFSYFGRKEAGLQVFGLFLCDYLLKNEGLLASVLPLSTFYTIGGKASKMLLKEKYAIHALIESGSQASFSDDSQFKEIVLIAEKKKSTKATFFIKNYQDPQIIAQTIFEEKFHGVGFPYYDLYTLPPYLDNNWLVFFNLEIPIQKIILNFLKKGLETKDLTYWNEIFENQNLVRGFEMYGPKFFFLPNDSWYKQEETHEMIHITHTKTQECLKIPREYLVKSLSKPRLYYDQITPKIDTYGIILPPKAIPEFPSDVQKYIQWGISSGTPDVAIRAFGEFWYSHIWKTIQTKQPFGQVFMGDKIDLNFTNRSVFAHYSETPVTASKNFYIVLNISTKYAKALAAWLNSSYFIAILLFFSRKMSETWTRLLENDYLELPFPNFREMPVDMIDEIGQSFDEFRNISSLPSIWKQLHQEYRLKLDTTFAKALKLENPQIYAANFHKYLLEYRKNMFKS